MGQKSLISKMVNFGQWIPQPATTKQKSQLPVFRCLTGPKSERDMNRSSKLFRLAACWVAIITITLLASAEGCKKKAPPPPPPPPTPTPVVPAGSAVFIQRGHL